VTFPTTQSSQVDSLPGQLPHSYQDRSERPPGSGFLLVKLYEYRSRRLDRRARHANDFPDVLPSVRFPRSVFPPLTDYSRRKSPSLFFLISTCPPNLLIFEVLKSARIVASRAHCVNIFFPTVPHLAAAASSLSNLTQLIQRAPQSFTMCYFLPFSYPPTCNLQNLRRFEVPWL